MERRCMGWKSRDGTVSLAGDGAIECVAWIHDGVPWCVGLASWTLNRTGMGTKRGESRSPCN